MSYQVLARKYRPRRFADMVGQVSVLRALSHALEQHRLHHAYLFTGARGVGKTSLARLFAKCLNCIPQISTTPCDHCEACLAITQGRFIDLIEVDAASRTKVEDTRELLDHVQYAPTVGRYKVYLIDEVHMLSTHSFNALLKTLEEPPAHTVFLLATTEPKRLPATVLSRCLQFHLRNLSLDQITQQLEKVLAQEGVSYDKLALLPLARAAEGSLRDAFSLLEQAILYGGGAIRTTDVQALLGSISEAAQYKLIKTLVTKDANALMKEIAQLAEEGADFDQALVALLSSLHQINVCQHLPEADVNLAPEITQFAQQMHPEQVQLYYQIALIGRRDLALSPTPRLGFEMTLLRMLTFQPVDLKQAVSPKPAITQTAPAVSSVALLSKSLQKQSIDWSALVKTLPITGITRLLAENCSLECYENGQITLCLDQNQSALHHARQESLLAEVLSQHFNQPIRLQIRIGSADSITPAQQAAQQRQQSYQFAQSEMAEDVVVKSLIKRFDAAIISVQTNSGSISPKEDTIL